MTAHTPITAPLKPGWLVRQRTYMEHGRFVTETLPADHEDEPCDGCGLIYCSCDDGREEAASFSYYERVSPCLGAARVSEHQL